MGQFNFGKKVIICGHVFWLDAGNDMFNAQKDVLSEEAKNLAKNPDEESLPKITEIYRRYVDLLLGGGAFDSIFENRNPNPYDMTALMNYLTEELKSDAAAEDNRSETRVLLDEILDGMDDTQLAQMITIAGALK